MAALTAEAKGMVMTTSQLLWSGNSYILVAHSRQR